jgi:FkbM family methyltransferase
MNIEPVAAWFQKLRQERPEDINLQIAASNASGELLFFEVVDTGLSTTNAEFAMRHAKDNGFRLIEYNVPTKTVTDICREEKILEIHFLKIDVEGSEAAVLQGIDFAFIRPWIILVEATLPNTQIEDYKIWESSITNAHYHFVYFDGLNRFYVSDEHQELDVAFQTPPNYWDGFVTVKEYKSNQLYQHLKGEYKQLQDQHQHLQREYQHRQGEYQLLQEEHQLLQGKYQSISREIYELKNGRLRRITAPLRRVGDLERSIKQRFRQENSGGDRLNLGKIKLPFKQLLIRIAGLSLRLTSAILKLLPQSMRQALKLKVLSFLAHFPRLKTWLKRLYYAISGYLARKSITPAYIPTELQHLSPRARKIYIDLQAVVARQQKEGN